MLLVFVGAFVDWGVVFADHGPSHPQRGFDQSRLKHRAEIVLGHDANNPPYMFNFSHLENQYCYKMPGWRTSTALGSDTIDVSALFTNHGKDQWPHLYGAECLKVHQLFQNVPQYVNPDACDGQNPAPPHNPCMCYDITLSNSLDRSPQKKY